MRIPIFIKLTVLFVFVIFSTVSIIGFSILEKQKEQFTAQLIDLGLSMVHIASNNAPENLLGEEDLALFQLVKDIAESEQVLFALITDQNQIIRAHSRIEEVGRRYTPVKTAIPLRTVNGVAVSTFLLKKAPVLLFEKPIHYQNVMVGHFRIAISQSRIQQNIRNATMFTGILTIGILLFGIFVSLVLGNYFSNPIRKLVAGTGAIANGDFDHRVSIRRNDELGDLGIAFNRMAVGLAERDSIRETFGKYVSPEIRDEILSGRIPMDGEKRMATLLFSDLRDFTTFVERSSSEEVVYGMRSYFTAMEQAIRKNDGLVLQYVGDEIESVFGVPLWCEDHAEKAVMAAIEMRKHLEALNRERRREGLMPFRHGIGIHTGEVIAGNTGSENRPSYALIGDTVNLASRIQDLTKEYHCDILASEETVKQLKKPFRLKTETARTVKGYSKPIVVYQVIGDTENLNIE